MPASRPGAFCSSKTKALIQMLAIEYLEEAGFNVDAAGSAAEAMNKLALIPGGVDAAIVDMGLPDRKGDVLIREMRTLHPTLPVVIATGQGADSARDRSKASPTLLSCKSRTLRPAFLGAAQPGRSYPSHQFLARLNLRKCQMYRRESVLLVYPAGVSRD